MDMWCNIRIWQTCMCWSNVKGVWRFAKSDTASGVCMAQSVRIFTKFGEIFGLFRLMGAEQVHTYCHITLHHWIFQSLTELYQHHCCEVVDLPYQGTCNPMIATVSPLHHQSLDRFLPASPSVTGAFHLTLSTLMLWSCRASRSGHLQSHDWYSVTSTPS